MTIKQSVKAYWSVQTTASTTATSKVCIKLKESLNCQGLKLLGHCIKAALTMHHNPWSGQYAAVLRDRGPACAYVYKCKWWKTAVHTKSHSTACKLSFKSLRYMCLHKPQEHHWKCRTHCKGISGNGEGKMAGRYDWVLDCPNLSSTAVCEMENRFFLILFALFFQTQKQSRSSKNLSSWHQRFPHTITTVQNWHTSPVFILY